MECEYGFKPYAGECMISCSCGMPTRANLYVYDHPNVKVIYGIPDVLPCEMDNMSNCRYRGVGAKPLNEWACWACQVRYWNTKMCSINIK